MVVRGLSDFYSDFELAEQHEFDPAAVLSAVSVEFDALVCTIDIVVDRQVRSRWVARFGGVVENRLAVGDWFMPEEHTTHPLLLDHVEGPAELYFHSTPMDANTVSEALVAAHKTVLGDWRPIDRYLNPNVSTDALLASGSGQLAVGPVTLIAEMATMTSGSLRTNTVKSNPPKRWNAQAQRFEEIGETVLLLSSEAYDRYPSRPTHRSYVIAASCSVASAGQNEP